METAILKSTTFALKNGMCVTIRKAIETDARGMLDCLRIVTGESRHLLLTPEELDKDFTVEKEIEWIRKFSTPRSLVLVAEYDSRIVAIADITGSSRRRQLHLGTLGISILNDFCNSGLGSAMLGMIMDWARSEPGLEKIALAVNANNDRAIHVYKKFGFTEEGRRIKEVKYEDGTYADDILMYCLVK
jgi:RimJ/RimL family protein N-acetyltransferase